MYLVRTMILHTVALGMCLIPSCTQPKESIPPEKQAGPQSPAPPDFQIPLDRARVEADHGHWKPAMIEAQAVLRKDHENQAAQALLIEVAPHIWAGWEKERVRRSEWRTPQWADNPKVSAINTNIRNGERYEKALMPEEALKQYRTAIVGILLLPPDPWLPFKPGLSLRDAQNLLSKLQSKLGK